MSDNKLSIANINYISKELATYHSKNILYLYYIYMRKDFPNMDIQSLLAIYPPNDLTDDAIIINYVTYVSGLLNVSELCNMLVFVKSYQYAYVGIIDSISTYPNYTVTKTDISNRNNVLPDKSLTWELNRICPQLAGLFFENIVSYVLGTFVNTYNFSEILTDITSNTTISNEIISILQRSFVTNLDVSKVNLNSVNTFNESMFISQYHYLMFSALFHTMKRDLSGELYECSITMLEYITKHVDSFDKYILDLGNTTIIKSLKCETNLRHGLHVRTKTLHGTLDFSSDTSIIDIKVYKKEDVDSWFAQLYLYMKLTSTKQKLQIINLYTNSLYSFTINK